MLILKIILQIEKAIIGNDADDNNNDDGIDIL